MKELSREEIILEIISYIGEGRLGDLELAKRNLGRLDDVALRKMHSDLRSANDRLAKFLGFS